MIFINKRLIVILFVLGASLGGWSASKSSTNMGSYSRAKAVIQPMKNQRVTGVFLFEQVGPGVMVTARLSGLVPNQAHGVHIHEWGDISDSTSGKSAGGHYNPEGHPHGRPPDFIRHAGAFGNIVANSRGDAVFRFLDTTISILGIRNPILGRSVVVHANPDTGEQPVGNAGPRIGVGVIGVIAPE